MKPIQTSIVAFILTITFASISFAQEPPPVLPEAAPNSEGISPIADLIVNELLGNGIRVKLYSNDPIVDAALLMSNINDKDTADTVHKKIDEQRRQLYPNEEITLEIEDANTNAASKNSITLDSTRIRQVGFLVLWNRTVEYQENLSRGGVNDANTCTIRVHHGAVWVWQRNGANWIYTDKKHAGEMGVYVNAGKYNTYVGCWIKGAFGANMVDFIVHDFKTDLTQPQP